MNKWFRFYDEALDDPKVQKLSGDDFKLWVNLLCLASRNGGKIPPDDDAAFSLRIDNIAYVSLVDRLSIAGLIDTVRGGAIGWHIAPHGWSKRQYKSDTSSDRVKRFRAVTRNVTCNADVTPPDTETDTDTDTEEKNKLKLIPKARAEGKISREVSPHFEEFWNVYPKRSGSADKPAALKAFIVKAKTVPPEKIIEGAKRYAEFCEATGQTRTPFVRQARTWLNASGWEEAYEIPESHGPPKTEQDKKLAALAVLKQHEKDNGNGLGSERDERELREIGSKLFEGGGGGFRYLPRSI